MSTKQIEALKKALEALEEINKLSIGENAICLPAEIDTAMDAIREALAEQPANVAAVNTSSERVDKTEENVHEQPAQKQKPVAWMHPNWPNYTGTQSPVTTYMVNGWKPLYTSPPASKPWVGLTRDERMDIINRFAGQDWVYAVEAIEAKLREKNT